MNVRRPNPNRTVEPETGIRIVPLAQIVESDRLRLRRFPYPGIAALAKAIEERGQTTPLFVQPKSEKLELISGYRRRAALEKLGAETAIVRVFTDLTDEEAYDLAISENQDRDALSEMERAGICVKLRDEGKTRKQIARRMGWQSEKFVDRYLRLATDATPALRAAVQAREISLNAALVFIELALQLPEDEQQEHLAAAVEKELPAKLLRTRLTRALGRPSPQNGSAEPILKLNNGGFILRNMRFDPGNPAELDAQADRLRNALKRVRRLQRALAKEEK